MIVRGMAVMCTGPSFQPVPGRVAASHDQPGRWWVTVCLGGIHLPQVYSSAELAPLTSEEVARSGLCAECASDLSLALAP